MSLISLRFILSVSILCQYSHQKNQVDYNKFEELLPCVMAGHVGVITNQWRLIRIATSNSLQTIDAFRNAIERNFDLKIIEARKGQIDVAVSPSVKQYELEKLIDEFHFSYQMLHTDIGRLLDENEGRKKRSINNGDVFDRYMNLDEMESYFSYLEILYPRTLKKEIIGKSFEGRNIYMFTIKSNLPTVECQPTNHKDQDLLDLNKLGRLGKLASFFGSLSARSYLNTKEIPPSVLRRAHILTNNTHNFIYFDSQSLGKDFANPKKVEKPAIFLDGGTHSREWISPAASLYLIKHLAENPKLTEKIDWKIVPLANPDGYVYSWKSDRFWRKTRSTTNYPGCFGTDINRNFGHHWGEVDTSNFPCYENYGGPYEFSEAETVALRDQLIKEKHRLKAYISVHNWGQDIIYPYSYTKEQLPFTDNELKRVGNGMVKSISDTQRASYETGAASLVLYPASGTCVDWVYDVLEVPLVYLFELRDNDGILGFSLPENLIKQTSEDLVSSMTYLASIVAQNITCPL